MVAVLMGEEESGEQKRQRGMTKPLVIAAVLVVVLAGAGVAGYLAQAAGYGFLGYRTIVYEPAQLYVLNLSDKPHYLSIDGRESQRIEAQGARLFPLVGGRSHVEVVDDEEQRRDWEVETDGADLFLNLAPQGCLVVSELTGVGRDEEIAVDLVDFLDDGDELYYMGTRSVVWPRGYPGAVDVEDGEPMVSIEVVDCWMFDDQAFLRDYLKSRFEERLL